MNLKKPGVPALNNKMNKISLKTILSKKQYAVVAAFFVIVLLLLIDTFFTGNNYPGPEPVRIQINKGENLNEITHALYKQKIIPSKFNFKIAAYLLVAEKRIKPGRYVIPKGLSYLDLIEKFVDGDGDILKSIDLYNGITMTGLRNKLVKTLSINPREFATCARDKEFLDSLGVKANSFEGYLMPGEYDFFERSSAKEIIEIMYAKFNRFFSDSLKHKASQLGYSEHQILTLASIVEGETKNETEMPIIAGVYLNRLKIGMKLQADPTVEYLKESGWKRLSFNDLKADSPYNTYKYFGLPPGPINNPGKQAILAALNPQRHNYLFFVADGKGTHKFSRNFKEHIVSAKEYRKHLDRKK
jgi:UPF0755 protein